RNPELCVGDLLRRRAELRGALARARRAAAARRVRPAAPTKRETNSSYSGRPTSTRERFGDAAGRLRVGDALDPETQMGSLISTAHRDKVHAFVEEAREEGAEVVLGGEPGDRGAFYPPTVITGVENRMIVAQEEIFGPVATVI